MKFLDHVKSLFVRPSFTLLSDILSNEMNREELLGMRDIVPPTDDQILKDANHIISYSSKTDFAVWSREAWAKVLGHLDMLQSPRATQEEVNFHRAALAASLNLLRIAYQARKVKEHLERDIDNDSSAR